MSAYGIVRPFSRSARKQSWRGALNKRPDRDVVGRHAEAWIENRHSWPAKKRLSDYFRENFYVTTSGNFHTPALLNTMLEIGADRIMFSTDWPFENIDHAAVWFDACPISENDRLKIGRENARRLFRLGN